MTAYHSGLDAIDNIGLANRTMTRGGFGVPYLEAVKPAIIVFHARVDGKIREASHRQSELLEHARANGLEHVCNVVLLSRYTLTVYAEPSALGGSRQALLEACESSSRANGAPHGVFLRAMAPYRFFDFWAESVRGFSGAAVAADPSQGGRS